MKPILFTKDNRLKFIAGTKTQTRRVIIPQPDSRHCRIDFENGVLKESSKINGCWHVNRIWKPRYSVGETVYLPEPYQIDENETNFFSMRVAGEYLDDNKYFEIDVDDAKIFTQLCKRKFPYRKTAARFMYKSLARHFATVTKVRAEQGQDISEADAIAEGVIVGSSAMGHIFTAIEHFKGLWDSINAKRGYGWEKNPWNFVYDLKKA